MSFDTQVGFESVEEFLAHGHGLEEERAECYKALADSMQTHGNHTVATLFRRLSRYGETHAEQLISHASEAELLKIPPWKYQWLGDNHNENCHEGAHYLMTPYEALRLALRIEQDGLDFYQQSVDHSQETMVKEIAVQMVKVKQQHLATINEWLHTAAEEHQPAPEDWDPPNSPE